MRRTHRTAAVVALMLSTALAAPADTVSYAWFPQTVEAEVGELVSVELWAYSDTELQFNAAQAVLQWDAGLITLTGNVDPHYPPPPADPIWTSSFPFGDSFGLNESNPIPIDGNGLWIGEVAVGQTWPVTPDGLLLTTLTFEAVAPGSGTIEALEILQLPGRPPGRSKFLVGTYNVLAGIAAPVQVTILGGSASPPCFDCLAGPDILTPPAGCEGSEFFQCDINIDGDVDLADFATHQELFVN